MTSKYPLQPVWFVGKHVLELPTPSFVLSRRIIERNSQKMLQEVDEKRLAFRPHVKTLKCVEATRIMLKGSKHTKVVVSTLREAWGLLPLVEEGIVTEILYGMPLRPGALPDLFALSRSVKTLLLIDHESHIDILEAFHPQLRDQKQPVWDVFIKIDVGAQRAGIPVGSPRLSALVERAEVSTAVSITGLYAYGGQSYDCDTIEGAESVLHTEVSSLIRAGRLVTSRSPSSPIVLSFGTTPTAHVVTSLQDQVPADMTLELHPGNYIANDLMQVGTGSVQIADQGARVIAEVCGLYPERNEAILNAGGLALTKETAAGFPGFAMIVNHPGWHIKDVSQEHGIMARDDSQGTEVGDTVEKVFKIGDKVLLHVPHSCITASAYPHYFVVDGEDVVQEVWVPWKGW